MFIKVYLSVTSHNDDEIIIKNYSTIPKFIGCYELIIAVIDNTSSKNLKSKSKKLGFRYYSDNINRGYGANNNKNFNILEAKKDDIFIVCNPDISINIDNFGRLLDSVIKSNADIYGVKVFESFDFKKWSSHNRSFPALFDPIISIVFKNKLFENDVDTYAYPDWIGGAFMIFKSESYSKLKGFDESFFMYYEDTDLCHRAKILGMTTIYDPNYFIIHDARRAGRKLFSKSFFMNLKSMLTYFRKHPTFKLISI
jgi:N-acetylglucosaminyl-diphospho-decaprenol L-rhamnosyltransferase